MCASWGFSQPFHDVTCTFLFVTLIPLFFAYAQAAVDCTGKDSIVCSPDACGSDPKLAQVICPQTCGFCASTTMTKTTTTSVPPPGTMTTISRATEFPGVCEDKVFGTTLCSEFQATFFIDICSSQRGRADCPVFCGLCTPTSSLLPITTVQTSPAPTSTTLLTSPIPTTTAPTSSLLPITTVQTSLAPTSTTLLTSPIPTTTATTTIPVDPCHDSIGNGLMCSQVPNICKDIYGHILCKRFCKRCQPTPGLTLPAVKPLAPGTCVDHVVDGVVSCARLPNVCSDSLAGVFCPKHCGICQIPCVDHLLGNIKCSMIPGICRSDIGKLGCPHHCHTCNGTGPSPPPDAPTGGDMIGNGLSCRDIPGVCQDPVGTDLFCKGFCTSSAPQTSTLLPTSTLQTTPMTTVKTTPACRPRKLCVDSLNPSAPDACVGLWGPGHPFLTKAAFCADPLGAKFCARTCDCPGFCPQSDILVGR